MIDEREIVRHAADRLAPPEPSFERLVRRRDRKQRNSRIAAGTVGLAVFAATLWIFTAAGTSDGGLTPGGEGRTVVPKGDRPVGIVGLPPADAIPSSPSVGVPVVSFFFGHTEGDWGRYEVHVYEDGRLLWQDLGGPTGSGTYTAFIEQHLTPEGVELVRTEVLASGLFEQDALHLKSAPGLAFGQIEVRDGGRLATVTWGDMPGNADGIEPTPEQADALFRLDARLENPASWLPASAWQDQEMRPFIASRYDACYETSENVGLDAVLATFPQPAEDLLRTHDRTERRLGQDGSFGTLNVWCSVITTDEARTLAAIFDEDAGIYSHENVFGQDYVVGRRSPNVPDVRLSMEPMLPHEPSP